MKLYSKIKKAFSSTIFIQIIAVSFLVFGIFCLFFPFSEEFKNLAPELVGISITVLILDKLYQYRDDQKEKNRIIRQISSTSHDFAIEALRIAEEEKWLFDGSLKNINLSFANLKHAILWGSDLEGCRFAVAKLKGANLRECILINSNFLKANLIKANLFKANLTGSKLKETILDNANLEYANMSGTDLTNASLKSANLIGADFSNAKIINTNFKSAIYNHETVWDDSFDPISNGLIFKKQKRDK